MGSILGCLLDLVFLGVLCLGLFSGFCFACFFMFFSVFGGCGFMFYGGGVLWGSIETGNGGGFQEIFDGRKGGDDLVDNGAIKGSEFFAALLHFLDGHPCDFFFFE